MSRLRPLCGGRSVGRTEFPSSYSKCDLKVTIRDPPCQGGWFGRGPNKGKGIKYIHANNGVIETKFNNGDIEYNRDSRISWHRENPTKQTLFNKFERAMIDLIGRRK